jgi:hypothetical protein
MTSKKAISALKGASSRIGEALRACEALMAPQMEAGCQGQKKGLEAAASK